MVEAPSGSSRGLLAIGKRPEELVNGERQRGDAPASGVLHGVSDGGGYSHDADLATTLDPFSATRAPRFARKRC
jgi:hypothetical protein